jgi:hypothetical protein
MLIFTAALLVAFAWRALRSSRRPPVGLTLRWIGMPVLAALLQFALGLPFLAHVAADLRLAVVLASYGLIGFWLIANTVRQSAVVRVCGAIVSTGWLANTVAIVANRGMPVSRSALAAIGNRHPSVTQGNLFKHVLETPHTVLPWLGDVIPVAVPVLRNVISVGDVLMCIGAMLLLVRVDFSRGSFSWSASRSPRHVVLQVPRSP